MRKVIFLAIILILSTAFVSADSYQKTTERVMLEEGQSIEFNGKRLTLLNLDFENERAIICVNGERTILGMRKTKTINEAILELKKVTMNKAEIRIWINCPSCECDESCDNSVCFNECYKDEDCDDGNDLTEDECYGIPKSCHNKKVKECVTDEDCDDMEECTTDKCSEIGKCVHTETDCKEGTGELGPVTSGSVIQKTTKYAQTIHPLLLSIAFGAMVIAIMIKKFKY